LSSEFPSSSNSTRLGDTDSLVAEKDSLVAGYAGSTRFRPKVAYDTTVGTTIYCVPEFIGKGLGTQL